MLFKSVGTFEGGSMSRSDALFTISDYESAEDGTSDFSSLYADEVISLVVCGTKFSAHRSLLASKSPVFGAMFKYEFREKEDKCVVIEDVDPKVFEQFLKYVYKGKLDQQTLDQFGLSLWIFADKYQIDPLKRLCEENMIPDLSPKNVISTLLLAELHHIVRIRLKCIDYINSHSAEVLKRKDQWRLLVTQAPPELFSELYRDLAIRKVSAEQKNANFGSKRSLVETQQNYQSLDRLNASRSSERDLLKPKSKSGIDNPGSFLKVLSYISFIVVCIGFIVFLGYVIYSGITLSTAYLLLVIVFAIVVVYICLRFRVPWCKNKI